MKEKKKEFQENKITGFFDKNAEFIGELSFKGSFRIDGHFKGKIQSDSMLIVGDQARIEADVWIGHIIIGGLIKGNIHASNKVEINNKGRVIGTIITPNLVVEEGAYLEATCQTGKASSSGAEITKLTEKQS